MEIKELAQTIYNLCCDMDYQDYAETEEGDVNALETELLFLNENGYNTLIFALYKLIQTLIDIQYNVSLSSIHNYAIIML